MSGPGADALMEIYGSRRPSPTRLLEAHVIFDSDVLVLFAQIRRSQLIRAAFADRVDVPQAIHRELRGLKNSHPDLEHLFRPDFFGRVHQLSREEAERAYEQQRAWTTEEALLADPKKPRGEAECLRLALRPEFTDPKTGRSGPFVVHDMDARRAAPPYNIDVYTVVEVLAAMTVAGHLLPENAWQRWVDMGRAGYIDAVRDWKATDEDRDRFMRLVELCRP